MHVALIDYGMGNLHSVRNALVHLGVDVRVIDSPTNLDEAGAVILPGVGAFGRGMEELERRGLANALVRMMDRGTPFLGICLGLQLLAERSFELGEHRGLGRLGGDVVRFEIGPEYRVPHIGWNDVVGAGPLFRGLPKVASFYFVHSYHLLPTDPGVVSGRTEYGTEFVSAVHADNVFAVQFHPEKSHKHGLALLKNFVDLARIA